MTYTDQILELFKRKPAHPDPKVDRAILRVEIEGLLYKVRHDDLSAIRGVYEPDL